MRRRHEDDSMETIRRHDCVTRGRYAFEKDLAAGAVVSLRAALPFPRLLLLFPDRVQTPPNTPAISL